MTDFKYGEITEKQVINYSEAYNPEIGLLINVGSKWPAFHRLTNKKYNAAIIHHAIQPKKFQ